MRPRELEHYIEIPLSEYRKLVEEAVEFKFIMTQCNEDLIKARHDLKAIEAECAFLKERYEQVVVELESYKRAYDYKEAE